jgi:hypothetical protein
MTHRELFKVRGVLWLARDVGIPLCAVVLIGLVAMLFVGASPTSPIVDLSFAFGLASQASTRCCWFHPCRGNVVWRVINERPWRCMAANMLEQIKNYLRDVRDRQRITVAMQRGTAMRLARNIDLRDPSTWEFSGFSQNGEDGILDVLRAQLTSGNRYFVEVGASGGIQNNTSWLVVAENYNGLMIDGNQKLVERLKRLILPYSIGLECRAMFVTQSSVTELKSLALSADPDVFSLDLDGNDYFVAMRLLEQSFRPKIIVVEYNSAYGPDRCTTIEYQSDFDYNSAHPTQLYYGVSVSGWRKALESHGYRFVTVDRNGVNAFFVDPSHFSSSFLNDINGAHFVENRFQLTKWRMDYARQYELIADQKFHEI